MRISSVVCRWRGVVDEWLANGSYRSSETWFAVISIGYSWLMSSKWKLQILWNVVCRCSWWMSSKWKIQILWNVVCWCRYRTEEGSQEVMRGIQILVNCSFSWIVCWITKLRPYSDVLKSYIYVILALTQWYQWKLGC